MAYCVLALLARRERYGFELVRTLSGVDGLVTSEGTIYPLLSRLRRDGYVTTTWRDSGEGPPRKFYAMRPDVRNPLVEDYLARLRRVAARLPRSQRDDLVADLTAHLDAGAAEAGSDPEIRNLLDAVGDPDDIVAEAVPGPAETGPSGALAGGLGVPVLWLAGLGLVVFSIRVAIVVIILGWRALGHARRVGGRIVLALTALVVGVIALVVPVLFWSMTARDPILPR